MYVLIQIDRYNNGVFSKLYKLGNIANKCLQWEEQNKFCQKIVRRVDWTQDLLIITDVLLTVPVMFVLGRRFLKWTLFHVLHHILDFDDF